MDCPRDNTEMQHQGFWKYPRHACPECHGLFVAERDITENIGAAGRKFGHVAEVKLDNVSDSSLKCPKDGATMKAVRFGNAEVDICPSCNGLWLDRGEYEKIVATVQRQVDAITPNRRLKEDELPKGPSALEEKVDTVVSVLGWFVMPRWLRRHIDD